MANAPMPLVVGAGILVGIGTFANQKFNRWQEKRDLRELTATQTKNYKMTIGLTIAAGISLLFAYASWVYLPGIAQKIGLSLAVFFGAFTTANLVDLLIRKRTLLSA